MDRGLWIWPADPKDQRIVLRRLASSGHLMAAFNAIARSKEGMSNSELDQALADNSNWMTLWLTRQLLALGFIEYTVDFFGGPGKYALTERGKNVMATLAGQPSQPKPPAPSTSQIPPSKA